MRQVIRSVPSRLFRTWLQDKFFAAGVHIHKHAGKVLFCGLLALVASCAALKSAAIETRVDKLWVAGESVSLSLLTDRHADRRMMHSTLIHRTYFRPLSARLCSILSLVLTLSLLPPLSRIMCRVQRMAGWKRSCST